MDWGEVDERMAAARLRAALEAHILATEEAPPEVSEQTRALYDRHGQT